MRLITSFFVFLFIAADPKYDTEQPQLFDISVDPAEEKKPCDETSGHRRTIDRKT